ncbi:MAG: hypothetical protein NVSMB21_25490 [Vulcanimicrobiaceae bacterium]
MNDAKDKCDRAARIIHIRALSFDMDPVTNTATALVCACGWATGTDPLVQHEAHILEAAAKIREDIAASRRLETVT